MSYTDRRFREPSLTRGWLESASCYGLCWAWNTASNPAKLRTEEEHLQAAADGRAILTELRRRFREGIDYTEMDSGRLLPRAGAS